MAAAAGITTAHVLSGFVGLVLAFVLMLAVILLLPYVVELFTRKRYPPVQAGGAVLITGTSTGIGRHAALYLADQGFLVFAGVRRPVDGEALKARAQTPANIVPVILDVTKPEQIEAALATVKEELAARGDLPLVGLCNNAGVTGKADPVEFLPLDYNRFAFDVNYFGPLAVIKTFLPLVRQSQGRIVNVSSMAGIISRPLGSTYSCTKFAMEALSDTLRMELACHNVSVSVIQPGYIKSDIFDKAERTQDPLTPECEALYGHFYDWGARAQLIDRASDPIVCSQAIHHALTSPYPKTRYLVGNVNGTSANLLGWGIWIANDRLLDRMNTPRAPASLAAASSKTKTGSNAAGTAAAAGGGGAGAAAATRLEEGAAGSPQ